MATQSVNREVNIFIKSGEAEKVYDKLIQKEKVLNDELAKTADPKRIKALEAELQKLAEPIDRAAKKVKGELAPSLRDMQSVVAKLGAQLKHMSTSDADYSKVIRQYAQARAELAGIQQEALKVEQAHQKIANTNPFGRVLEFAKGSFLGGALLGVVEAGMSGITDFIKGSFDEAFQAEENAARLKATLDNIGRSDVFERLQKKGEELANKFKYLDNDDISAVFERLINYGKLTEKQMNDLLPVIIDFAAKQRIPIEEASTAIIGSLEGQGKALKQYGINIKEGGNETERLNIIMTTLKDKVDGAGEAFQNTAAGGVAVARQQFKNLQEDIGTQLLPALNKVLGVISDGIKGFRYLFGQIKSEADQEIDRQEMVFFNVEVNKRVERVKKAIENGKTTLDKLLKINASNREKNNFSAEELAIQDAVIAQLSTKAIGAGKDAAGTRDTVKKQPKVKDEYAEFLKDLKKLQDQVAQVGLEEQEKELLALTQKYDEMRKRAAGHKEDLLKLDELYFREYTVILDKFAQKDMEKFEKEDAARKQRTEKLNSDILKDAQASAGRLAARIAAEVDRENRDKNAGLQLQLLQARGKQRLDLELKLMDEEKRQALEKKGLTENEKFLIEEQYRKKRGQAELDFYLGMANQALSFAQQGLDLLATIDQAKTARENAELERDRRNNDKKKSNYERQLKAGLLTKMDFDRKVADLDKKQQEKEKQAQIEQFNREKKLKRASIVLNGLQAVSKTLAEFGPPIPPNFLGIVAMAFTLASTVSQLVAVGKEKPQFARGGRTSGRSHRDGGMAVVDQMGRKQAEVEGGEGIINKHSMADRSTYMVSGTPSQIASRINALRGGVHWESGATLVPGWRTATPSRMNFSGIRQRFEKGGVVTGAQSGGADGSQQLMADLAGSIDTLNAILATGIRAWVSLRDLNDQQARLEALKQDTIIR